MLVSMPPSRIAMCLSDFVPNAWPRSATNSVMSKPRIQIMTANVMPSGSIISPPFP